MRPTLWSVFTLIVLVFQPAGLRTVSQSVGTSDLWVSASTGNDSDEGTSRDHALQRIQAAADRAVAGTTIHILPGIYRESVVPALDGTAQSPIIYRAEDGPGTVTIRGSVPSSSLGWRPLGSNVISFQAGVDPANIYYTSLSAWDLNHPPRFIVNLDESGTPISRFMPAREPDWQVLTDWKPSEFWWLADGGSAVAACNPLIDADPQCDLPSRSFTELTDASSDVEPSGIESGSLISLGNLSGATLVAADAQHGVYIYRRHITGHDVAAGRVFVDEECDNDGTPGLGWGSKYYLENHPALLDRPGEWWFDVNTGFLFLWAPDGKDPATQNLEVSVLDNGFDLTNRSYTILDGLSIQLFNQQAYTIWNDDPNHGSLGNVVRNSLLSYANEGVVLYQNMDDRTTPEDAIDGFVLEDSEISYMDSAGINSSFWWPDAPSSLEFRHPGVRNSLFRNNQLHHLGFNSDARTAAGVRVFFPDRIRFVGNYLHDVASVGAQFHLSLIDSNKEYGFAPEEIKLGDILVMDNVFERTCLLASDCGALKFGGSKRPDTHVFRNVLIMGNVFRDTVGWSYVSALRKASQLGDGNGLYIDHASGLHVYRNISYNNTGAGYKLACLWRDGAVIFYNNIAANNRMYGFKMTGATTCDDHVGSVDTQLVNNILVNNEAYGMQIESAYAPGQFGNLTLDHNLYYLNGWNRAAGWGSPADILLFEGTRGSRYLQNLHDIRAGTPWETHGVEGDPGFLQYDAGDLERFDRSWPDFHLTASSSNALDRGTVDLPESLTSLLREFEVSDARLDAAYDIGRFEGPPDRGASARTSANPCLTMVVGLTLAPLFLAWRGGKRRRLVEGLRHHVSPKVLDP